MFEVKFGDEPLCEQYMVWTFMARNQYSSDKFNGSLGDGNGRISTISDNDQ